ncbi:MAG TPA: hypothetical protein VM537_06270, partial [Anaerolineae bacterium]|nr:hypothetical protein [Anaerolineae bacterium]
MKITNEYGLPEAIVKAVTFDGHEKRGDFSVTELSLPPRIRMLRLRHDDEIVEDASERLWMLQGSAIHDVLRRANVASALQEEQLTCLMNDALIYGTPDWYYENSITDFKITSVWSALAGVKPEWEAQLNIYGYMYPEVGFPVAKLQIAAILRDWSKGRAKQGGNYPPVPFMLLPVHKWPRPEVISYMLRRIDRHRLAEQTPDWALPICTPEERWDKPTTWAVMLKGNKNAKRVLESQAEAEQYVQTVLKPKDQTRAYIEE